MDSPKQRRTPEEVDAIGPQIEAEIAGGMFMKDACAKHGLDPSVFYGWRRRTAGAETGERRRKARSKALVPVAPTPTPETVHHSFPLDVGRPDARPGDYLTLKGSPEALARFIREMGGAR